MALPKAEDARRTKRPWHSRRQIADDYRGCVSKTPKPTWGAFLAGLKRADERKRTALGKKMTPGGVAAFCRWDRNTNGNARASLDERAARFLASTEGAGFAIATRKSASRIRDLLTAEPDRHHFQITDDALSFDLEGQRIDLPLTALINVGAGSERDRVFAADLVIENWRRVAKKPNADLASDFTEQVTAYVRSRTGQDMFSEAKR